MTRYLLIETKGQEVVPDSARQPLMDFLNQWSDVPSIISFPITTKPMGPINWLKWGWWAHRKTRKGQ